MTERRWHPWVWAAAGMLLLVPLVAMQVTREVAWTGSDFVAAAGLLGGAALTWELLAWRVRGRVGRLVAAGAVAVALVVLWAVLATG